MYKTGCEITTISANNKGYHSKYNFWRKGKDRFLHVLPSHVDGIIQKSLKYMRIQ